MDGLVLVIGSGLSCAEGLPGMGVLGQTLSDRLGETLEGQDRELWGSIQPLIIERGLEAALLKFPPTPTLEASISKIVSDSIIESEAKIFSEVFSEKKILRLTQLLKHTLKPPNGLPIITTNYDRLVELAAEEAGLGVDTMFLGNVAGKLDEHGSRLSFLRDMTVKTGKRVVRSYRDRVNVFKPHGSLDWYHRNGNPTRFFGHLDLPRMIITPGLNKYKSGYDSPFDKHREKGNSAIEQAGRILIIGYGFNDDHLETHLAPKLKRGTPTLMLSRSLSQKAMGVVRSCGSVIAIEYGTQDHNAGSLVWRNGRSTFLPDQSLWDLGNFVEEVLS